MQGCQDHYDKRSPDCPECARFAQVSTAGDREIVRLRTIERRAREAVAGYLATDTSVVGISELHPFMDNLRIACGMASIPSDR